MVWGEKNKSFKLKAGQTGHISQLGGKLAWTEPATHPKEGDWRSVHDCKEGSLPNPNQVCIKHAWLKKPGHVFGSQLVMTYHLFTGYLERYIKYTRWVWDTPVYSHGDVYQTGTGGSWVQIPYSHKKFTGWNWVRHSQPNWSRKVLVRMKTGKWKYHEC